MKDVKVRVITEGTGKASKEIKNVAKSAKDLDKQAGKANKTTKGMASNLTKGFGALRQSILNAVPALNAFKVALISTGVGAIVVALGSLIALFSKATKIGNKFAKEISTLGAITSKTNEELAGLSNQAKELGASTQFTAIEVVKLQTELAKLGFAVLDIRNATPAILDLAASLEIDLASAAELAGSVVRSFGLTTEDTKKVVDTLAKSTSVSGLNFEALRESLKVVAPTARATGVSLEKTTSLLAVLADNGLKGSMAGTGLAKTFIELSKKGITLEEAIDMVNSSSNGLNTSLELVGINGSKALNTLAASSDRLDPLLKQLTDVDDAAKKLAERRLDNAAGDVTKLGSAWDGFLLSLEDGSGVFSSMYRGIIQGTTAFITGLQYSIEFGGAFFKNFFQFISEGFESTKDFVSGSFGSLAGTIKVFALKASLAMAEVPIIGKALDKESISASLKVAEDELTASQDRMLKGMSDFGKATDLLSRTGILKTMVNMRGEQQETTALRTGGDTTTTDTTTTDEGAGDTEAENKERERLKKISDLKKEFIKKDQDLDAETEEEKLELERTRAEEKLAELVGTEEEKREALLALNEYYDNKEDELADKRRDEKTAKDKIADKEEVMRAKALASAKKSVQDATLNAVAGGLNILKSLNEESKGLQAAALVGEAGLGVAKMIIGKNTADLADTAFSATLGPAGPAYLATKLTANKINLITGLASTAAATAKGLQALGSSGGGRGSDSSGNNTESPQAPSFNLVEGTEGNSIKNSIENKSRNPIKAYVVSGEVESQSSLNRQIKNSSSI